MSKTDAKSKADTVRAIVQPEAPFDVLEWKGHTVGKFQEVDMPADVVEHRNAKFLTLS